MSFSYEIDVLAFKHLIFLFNTILLRVTLRTRKQDSVRIQMDVIMPITETIPPDQVKSESLALFLKELLENNENIYLLPGTKC